jgi:hypothetical protein
MIDWIELTQEDKDEFFAKANKPSSVPTMFNLQSDKNDVGGRFAEMSREEVLQAAEDSAKWLFKTIN